MVGVGGPYDNHHHIVSFATSYGDAERANVSGSLIVQVPRTGVTGYGLRDRLHRIHDVPTYMQLSRGLVDTAQGQVRLGLMLDAT